MLGVPTMYSAINTSKLLDQYDLSSLRFCISGGAPLPHAVQETFERLTGCMLVEGYGLTEAGPVCTLNPFGGARRPGSVGLPLPGTLVEIVSLDEPARRLPLGQRGEICITGPQVMAGYAERAEETAETLRGGRLHTGDVGYIDPDGYVYVVDRIKDLILNGGFNVYPRMVEEAILLHPAVAEASSAASRTATAARSSRPTSAWPRARPSRWRNCARSSRTSSPPSSSPSTSSCAPSCRRAGSASRPSARWSPRSCAASARSRSPRLIEARPVDGLPDGLPVGDLPISGLPVSGLPIDGQPPGAGEGAAWPQPRGFPELLPMAGL